MDYLVTSYAETIKDREGDVFEIFSNLYNSDLTSIEFWLKNQFAHKVVKNNATSKILRTEGNSFYAKKDFIKSLNLYTKSLCFSTLYSEECGLALANRSAVFFEMKDYDNCLKDIELCLETLYPSNLKPKIYIRKVECYYALNQKDLLDKCILDSFSILEAENIPDKEKFIVKLHHIQNRENKHPAIVNHQDHTSRIQTFSYDENQFLAYGSKKVKMRYNKNSGRHIVAAAHITRGDILFVEKSFIFAPIFKENKEFIPFKCYYCLEDTLSSIPCEFCTICTYCNKNCRQLSWRKFHQWECQGMQSNIWFDLGIAFPAFKAMLQGTQSGFQTMESSFEDDVKCFGDKEDNYRYFDRLLSHIDNRNSAPFYVMAAIVVCYLEKYTNFFSWLLKQPKCPKKNEDNLISYIGGLITKHIAQLTCNSSTIEHWTCSSTDSHLPDVLTTVACGIFPSVSIMNHSCRPNISNYFIGDTIVVKASEEIFENEEIFNCYGIDYRSMAREERKYACKELYNFECKCIICSNKINELDMLDTYLCPKCKGIVPENKNRFLTSCITCGEQCDLKSFRTKNYEAQKYLEKSSNQLELLLKSLKIREKILYKHHKSFGEVYYKLYTYYIDFGDASLVEDVAYMFKYFYLWLEIERAHKGNNSRSIGTKLYEVAHVILNFLKNGQQKDCDGKLLQNIEHIIMEGKEILSLYYPTPIIYNLYKEIQFTK